MGKLCATLAGVFPFASKGEGDNRQRFGPQLEDLPGLLNFVERSCPRFECFARVYDLIWFVYSLSFE